MVTLGVILIHNKGNAVNQAQIQRVAQGVTKVIDSSVPDLDEEGNPNGTNYFGAANTNFA